MFLPSTKQDIEQKQLKDTHRKEAYKRIETWALLKIPEKLRDGVEIIVQEVQCGDPNCAPIDTSVTILFPSGGRGMFGIPFESKDVTEQDLSIYFPSPNIIEKWADGQEQMEEEKSRNNAYKLIKLWVISRIPQQFKDGLIVSVREVACGDPNCSPIDTAIAIVFPSNGRGLIGIPLEAKDVTEEDIEDFFPTPEVIEAWGRGEEADWPPVNNYIDAEEEEPEFDLPPLRYLVGTKVQCRIGPDPITGWADGIITELWYRENSWPQDSFAPYRVKLDDGRSIYAPGDLDTIIRKVIVPKQPEPSYSMWGGNTIWG